MKIKIHFEQLDVVAESCVTSDPVTVHYDTPDGLSVYVRYDRVYAPDGQIIARIGPDCGCWVLESQDGCFSDISVEFVDAI